MSWGPRAGSRLPRARTRWRCKRLIGILQQREHFHHQQVVRLAQLRHGEPGLALVVRAELFQQVVDLVLERDLGEDADRLGGFEPVLQRDQIQRRGRGGRRHGGNGRWGNGGSRRCGRLRRWRSGAGVFASRGRILPGVVSPESRLGVLVQVLRRVQVAAPPVRRSWRSAAVKRPARCRCGLRFRGRLRCGGLGRRNRRIRSGSCAACGQQQQQYDSVGDVHRWTPHQYPRTQLAGHRSMRPASSCRTVSRHERELQRTEKGAATKSLLSGCRAYGRGSRRPTAFVIRRVAVVRVARITTLRPVAHALVALEFDVDHVAAGWGQAWMVEFVSVTAPVGTEVVPVPPARASPLKVPPVTVMSAPARMVPWKFEAVSVASWATHQYTFGHSVPAASPAMTTEKPVPVRAPVPPVPT